MKLKIKQFICGLFNHKFNNIDTDCKWNEKEDTYTITEICCRCGKQFSFTAPAKNFGLRIKQYYRLTNGVSRKERNDFVE